eukprot:1038290-Amphidinium_carterae.1
MAEVLAPKQLLLLEEVLTEAGYADVGVATKLRHGFALVGDCKKSKAFPELLKKADLTIAELKSEAEKRRRRLPS